MTCERLHMTARRRVLGFSTLAVLLVGCNATPPDSQPTDTWYHARVFSEDGLAAPFFLQLPTDCDTARATVVNGEERVPVACGRADASVRLDFEVYDTWIEAQLGSGGVLTGEWVRGFPEDSVVIAAFDANPIAGPDPQLRFQRVVAGAGGAESGSSIAGDWQFRFDAEGPGTGTLGQTSSGVVRGTVELESTYGDFRFLAGSLVGRELRLSSFDGQHAYLLVADVSPDATRMNGEVIDVGSEDYGSFVAERGGTSQLASPTERVQPTLPDRRIALEVLSDPAYAGVPLIVEIMGTWCPNCHDVTAVLKELYGEFGPDSLEIVSVAYEAFDDRDYNQERVDAYRETYEVPWATVLAEATLEGLITEGIGGLSPIIGVPVTIFMNRDGTVHSVYAGFSGPATGDAYRQATEAFRRLTIEILAGD